jgi:hypothetical protein
VATVIEIAAYYVPWLDNLLDSIASPMAVVAGILLSASMLGDVSPLAQWSLAIIAGGGTAAVVQGGTVATRLTSSTTSAGIGNPLFATLETTASAVLAVVSIVAPVIAVALILLVVGTMYYAARTVLRKVLNRRRNPKS